MDFIRELRARREEVRETATAMVNQAETDDRNLTDEEQRQYDEHLATLERLQARITRLENLPPPTPEPRSNGNVQAPAVLTIPRGDNETRALAQFIRKGDVGGVKHMQDGDNSVYLGPEQRASNDTTMNITTAGDGGNLVPTGHYQGIIARRDEMSIVSRLGVMRIPGKGTSVNVPFDNEDDGEFVTAAESGAFDRDAPAVGQVTFTLVKYTKKVDLTYELLEDEDSRLMVFLEDFVGRGMAKTHNNLLLTEVAANGTALQTFASATVIAIDELEPIVFNNALSNYLDDSRSVAWVMQAAVHGEIVLIDDANTRRYASNTVPDSTGRFTPTLLGYPVVYSAKSGATAASTKSVYFGNWAYVGLYEAPGFSLVRDPYTRSSYGEVILNYMFRADYGTLIAEAIGYGVHPSA